MTMQQVNFRVGQRLVHHYRGKATFTESCSALQRLNVDPSSIFIQLDGEDTPIEASVHLVKPIIDLN